MKTGHLRELTRVKGENEQAELPRKTADNAWTLPKLRREVNRTLGLIVQPPNPRVFAEVLFNHVSPYFFILNRTTFEDISYLITLNGTKTKS